MTKGWIPDIGNATGPRYLAIADAITDDIARRRLQPGMRLPTHRWLACQLGITVGTVTRAYREARERGSIVGEVGRGTFVSPRVVGERPRDDGRDVVDLTVNQPALDPDEPALRNALAELARREDLLSLLDYEPAPGKQRHRCAGKRWVQRVGLEVDTSNVIVTNGAQQGLLAAFAVLTSPGDVVATESLNYPGIRRLANLLRIDVRGLDMDEHGLVPASFDRLCRNTRVAALVCTPTIHNPTAIVLPVERRAEIAAIAVRHDVPIVEDDIYAQLPKEAQPPIYTMARNLCLYVAGTSKCIAPGLRIGYLVAPSHLTQRLIDAVHTTTWTASSLMAEITTMWINDGTADRFIQWHRREAAARQRVAREVLGDFDGSCHAASYHLWLRLPHQWESNVFVAQGLVNGVSVSSGSAFAIDSGPEGAHAVRVSLGSPRSIGALRLGLERIAQTLASWPAELRLVV